MSPQFLSFFPFSISGKVTIAYEGKQAVGVVVNEDSIMVDFRDTIPLKSRNLSIKSILSAVKIITEFALAKNTTVIIKLRGKNVLTIGKLANPKLSKMFTKNPHLQIHSLMDLQRLGNLLSYP